MTGMHTAYDWDATAYDWDIVTVSYSSISISTVNSQKLTKVQLKKSLHSLSCYSLVVAAHWMSSSGAPINFSKYKICLSISAL